jgi:hypothetical protein
LIPEQEAAFLEPYLEEAKAGGVLVVPPDPGGAGISLGPAGGALHRLSDTAPPGLAQVGAGQASSERDPAAQEVWKKLPETLAEVVQGFEGTGPIRLMFQDEARFGRIADARRCWCPKPFRPLVKAMLTQDST